MMWQRIDDTLDTLGGAQWFTTLDLASEVEVAQADCEKTAFAKPDRLYQFHVMAFGLCSVPGTFRRLMECALQGLHWSTCLVHLDDIIMYSRTIEEHLARLAEVFTRLWDANLKIKPSKFHLPQRSVHYPGHVVSAKGVETDTTKIKCIAQLKELKQFTWIVFLLFKTIVVLLSATRVFTLYFCNYLLSTANFLWPFQGGDSSSLSVRGTHPMITDLLSAII